MDKDVVSDLLVDRSEAIQRLESCLNSLEEIAGAQAGGGYEAALATHPEDWYNTFMDELDAIFASEASNYFRNNGGFKFTYVFNRGRRLEDVNFGRAAGIVKRMIMSLRSGGEVSKSKSKNVERSVILTKVFIVHGHDEALKAQVARVLGLMKLEPVILSEQPNIGQTIIEKFEENSDVGFAVVLMTGDDRGGSIADMEEGRPRKRARQNVILELGYFFGKLGRNRVCVLKEQEVEEPSDILGVVYQPVEPSGAWKYVLGKELRAAGYDVDLNSL